MIYDKLDWFQIWNKFFYNINTNFYKVIIHRSNPSDKINNLSFPYEIIDTVDSSWCFLVGVKKALVNQALKDYNVSGCIFISNNCIPIKNLIILGIYIYHKKFYFKI